MSSFWDALLSLLLFMVLLFPAYVLAHLAVRQVSRFFGHKPLKFGQLVEEPRKHPLVFLGFYLLLAAVAYFVVVFTMHWDNVLTRAIIIGLDMRIAEGLTYRHYHRPEQPVEIPLDDRL